MELRIEGVGGHPVFPLAIVSSFQAFKCIALALVVTLVRLDENLHISLYASAGTHHH